MKSKQITVSECPNHPRPGQAPRIVDGDTTHPVYVQF